MAQVAVDTSPFGAASLQQGLDQVALQIAAMPTEEPQPRHSLISVDPAYSAAGGPNSYTSSRGSLEGSLLDAYREQQRELQQQQQRLRSADGSSTADPLSPHAGGTELLQPELHQPHILLQPQGSIGGGGVPGTGGQGKPQICFDFTKGLCSRGDKCKYSHDLATIVHFNSKEKGICFDYLRNQCHRGLLCRFSHDLSAIAQQVSVPPTVVPGGGGGGGGGIPRQDLPRDWEGGAPPQHTQKQGGVMGSLNSMGSGSLGGAYEHAMASVQHHNNNNVNNSNPVPNMAALNNLNRLRTSAICYDFVKGVCSRGSDCRYSHDLSLIARTARGGAGASKIGEVCYDYLRGRCNRGPSCKYSHNLAFLATPGFLAPGELSPPGQGAGPMGHNGSDDLSSSYNGGMANFNGGYHDAPGSNPHLNHPLAHAGSLGNAGGSGGATGSFDGPGSQHESFMQMMMMHQNNQQAAAQQQQQQQQHGRHNYGSHSGGGAGPCAANGHHGNNNGLYGGGGNGSGNFGGGPILNGNNNNGRQPGYPHSTFSLASAMSADHATMHAFAAAVAAQQQQQGGAGLHGGSGGGGNGLHGGGNGPMGIPAQGGNRPGWEQQLDPSGGSYDDRRSSVGGLMGPMGGPHNPPLHALDPSSQPAMWAAAAAASSQAAMLDSLTAQHVAAAAAAQQQHQQHQRMAVAAAEMAAAAAGGGRGAFGSLAGGGTPFGGAEGGHEAAQQQHSAMQQLLRSSSSPLPAHINLKNLPAGSGPVADAGGGFATEGFAAILNSMRGEGLATGRGGGSGDQAAALAEAFGNMALQAQAQAQAQAQVQAQARMMATLAASTVGGGGNPAGNPNGAPFPPSLAGQFPLGLPPRAPSMPLPAGAPLAHSFSGCLAGSFGGNHNSSISNGGGNQGNTNNNNFGQMPHMSLSTPNPPAPTSAPQPIPGRSVGGDGSSIAGSVGLDNGAASSFNSGLAPGSYLGGGQSSHSGGGGIGGSMMSHHLSGGSGGGGYGGSNGQPGAPSYNHMHQQQNFGSGNGQQPGSNGNSLSSSMQGPSPGLLSRTSSMAAAGMGHPLSPPGGSGVLLLPDMLPMIKEIWSKPGGGSGPGSLVGHM